jgi:hypothetical protein
MHVSLQSFASFMQLIDRVRHWTFMCVLRSAGDHQSAPAAGTCFNSFIYQGISPDILLTVQALSEVVLSSQASQGFDNLFSQEDFAFCIAFLRVPSSRATARLSGLRSLDLSKHPMDNQGLCALRDIYTSVTGIETLTLNIILSFTGKQQLVPTATLSQLLCSFEDLKLLCLKSDEFFEIVPATAGWDIRHNVFGEMLKNSPRLHGLDMSMLLRFRNLKNQGGIKQNFIDAVAEARHSSLQLKSIYIHVMKCGDWSNLDLHGMTVWPRAMFNGNSNMEEFPEFASKRLCQ